MNRWRTLVAGAACGLACVFGCGSQTTVETGTQSPSAATAKMAAKAAGGTNLLELIKLPRDQVQGDFQFQDGVLHIPAGTPSVLELPVEPPAGYRLEMMAQRTSGRGSLNIGLVVGDSATMLVLDGWGIPLTGLSLVRGRTGDNNATTWRKRVFAEAEPVRIVCTVHPEVVRVEAAGEQIINWQGESSDLSVNPQSTVSRTPRRLTIGAWDAAFRVTELTLTSLSGETIAVVAPAGAMGAADITNNQAATTDGWVAFQAKDDRFSVRVPAPLNRSEIEGGTYYSRMTGEGEYAVAVYPTEREGKPAAEFLDSFVNEMFTEGERILNTRPLTLDGAESAKEVAVIDRDNDLILFRFFVTADRLYQVFYIGRPERKDAVETLRFLDSFRLIK